MFVFGILHNVEFSKNIANAIKKVSECIEIQPNKDLNELE